MSNLIIVWQIATACIAVGGGAIMGYTLYALRHQSDRYDASQYICANFSFNPSAHSDPAERNRLVFQIIRSVESDPNLSNVAVTNEIYGNNFGGDSRAWIDGVSYAGENDVPMVCKRIVSAGYFSAMDIPLLEGRDFTEKDDENNPVAIVTETFARKYYGTMDVLGRRFRMYEKGKNLTIVGVVPEVFASRYFPDHATGFFIPYGVEAWMDTVLFAKTKGDPAAYDKKIIKSVSNVDSRLIISEVLPMNEMRDRHSGGLYFNFLFRLFEFCSVAALIMASAGLFGIISFSTSLRKLEIGIRLAIGGSPLGAVLLVIRRGAIFVMIGMFIGILGVMLLRHALIAQLTIVPESLSAYLIAGAIVIFTSGIALFVPAFRVSLNEPFKALHEN